MRSREVTDLKVRPFLARRESECRVDPWTVVPVGDGTRRTLRYDPSLCEDLVVSRVLRDYYRRRCAGVGKP